VHEIWLSKCAAVAVTKVICQDDTALRARDYQRVIKATEEIFEAPIVTRRSCFCANADVAKVKEGQSPGQSNYVLPHCPLAACDCNRTPPEMNSFNNRHHRKHSVREQIVGKAHNNREKMVSLP
jgi:hypothetical protein